jgi:hypothetical protein
MPKKRCESSDVQPNGPRGDEKLLVESASDYNPLHLVKRDFVISPIVKAGCSARLSIWKLND